MNFDMNSILVSLLFGSIGMGMFLYGKQRVELNYVIIGILLMVYPYFVPGALLMFTIGLALTAVPFFI
ncbi:MAG: hypothetical protein GC162_06590 [Planctomycetes bacterium]|nr:hypothetical protein [Planctomycetota bacterium]